MSLNTKLIILIIVLLLLLFVLLSPVSAKEKLDSGECIIVEGENTNTRSLPARPRRKMSKLRLFEKKSGEADFIMGVVGLSETRDGGAL